MEQYLSLFEYLNKPAGSELGKQVAQRARIMKITTTSHEVSNPSYSGRIQKYPISFLDSYFRPPSIEAVVAVTVQTEDDELPF